MMEFLLEILKEEHQRSLDLLKEERQKRKEAEQELETLRAILKPLQQKEMDCIKKIRDESQSETKPVAGRSREDELGVYVRNAFPRRGRIVCDCGEEDHRPLSYDESTSYDEVDSKPLSNNQAL